MLYISWFFFILSSLTIFLSIAQVIITTEKKEVNEEVNEEVNMTEKDEFNWMRLCFFLFIWMMSAAFFLQSNH